MKRPHRRKRRPQRVCAVRPVSLDGVLGTTRDVSASGVFFETEAAYHKGSRIHFEINLDTPWGKAICDCDGKIVRVERRDGSVGIAVQFAEPKAPRAKVRKPRRSKR
jgi:hypothetical protein